VRIAATPLILAGLLAIGARGDGQRGRIWYLVGAVLPLLALGWWQLATFESPLITTYQAAKASPSGHDALDSFFSTAYAFGSPQFGDQTYLGGMGRLWRLPNVVLYPLQLVGLDGFLAVPGIGLVGMVGLAWFAHQRGPAGVVGRFGLATLLLTLLVYVPYFWQSGRFMMVLSPLFAVASAALVVQALTSAGAAVRQWRGSFTLSRDLRRAQFSPAIVWTRHRLRSARLAKPERRRR
jgi:hypothetical protein